MDKKEEKLLGINKVTVGRKKDGNLTGVRMLFKYSSIGTEFFVYREVDGFLFSKKEIKKRVLAGEAVVRATAGSGNASGYINMRPFVDVNEDKIYKEILEVEDGFLVKDAGVFEKEAFAHKYQRAYKKSGKIHKNNTIHVIRKDRERLLLSGSNYIMTLHLKDYSFMEISCVNNPEDYPTPKEVIKMRRDGQLNNVDSVSFTTNQYGSSFYIPTWFMKMEGIEKETFLNTWITVDNRMVVELNPIICKVCHNPINRRIEKVVKVDITKENSKILPKVSEYVREESGTSKEKIDLSKERVKAQLQEIGFALYKVKELLNQTHKENI